MSLITPVILVGGSGKRLWPLSRESMPKQFVPLLGTQSTFQQTLERVADRSLFARPVIATNDAYRFMAEQQAKEIGMEIDILVEPSRRDFGPGDGRRRGLCPQPGRQGRAGAGVGPSGDRRRGVPRRLPRGPGRPSQQGGIVTFGIPPTEPKTDYGYIRPGSERIGPVQKVAAFVEKPNAQTALRYIAEGLLWNSGNFLFPPELLLVGDGPLRARHGRRRRGSRRQGQEDRLDGVPRCRGLRQGAGQVDRLRRHGAHRQMLGRAGQVPLVRPRHLGRAARCRRGRQRRQRHRGAGRDRPCAQFLRPLRRAADRRDRRRGSGRRGDERCRAGRPSRQPSAAEGRRAAHVGRQAPGRDRARRDAPAVGQLPGHRPRRALPRQAADRQSRRQAQPAEPQPARRALGRGQGHRPR